MNNNKKEGDLKEGGGGYSLSSPEKEGLIREGSLQASFPLGGYRKIRSPK